MPIMIVLALIVLIRVLDAGHARPGQSRPIGPGRPGVHVESEARKLWDPQTWLAASGQIFFSLSVGFGIIVNYASYLRENDDVVLSGLTSSSMNEFFEVCLGGLITLPAAFIFLGSRRASHRLVVRAGLQALPNVFAA